MSDLSPAEQAVYEHLLAAFKDMYEMPKFVHAECRRVARDVGAAVREAGSPAGPAPSWVWVNPGRLGGKPCIRGTRVPVALILEWLEAGYSVAEILDSYPSVPVAAIEHIRSWTEDTDG